MIKSAGGWGETENNLVLEGWLGDRIVCRRKVGESRYAAGITARADDSVLYADGDTYDATRITVKAVDNMGNLLPFTQECVEIQLDGPARLLGPARFPPYRRHILLLDQDGGEDRHGADRRVGGGKQSGMYS